jgi:hypothetical protein
VLLNKADKRLEGSGITRVGGDVEDALEQTLVFLVQVLVLHAQTKIIYFQYAFENECQPQASESYYRMRVYAR